MYRSTIARHESGMIDEIVTHISTAANVIINDGMESPPARPCALLEHEVSI